MYPGYQGGWVLLDVLPDSVEGLARPHDMLPVVTLPNRFSKPLGNRGFEGTDNHGEGSGVFCQDQHAVDMIGHHYECIERNMRKMLRDLVPAGGDNGPIEDAAAITRADSYEVRAWS